MNFQLPALRWALLPAKIRGMFNLNDPRWGRDDDKSSPNSGSASGNDAPPATGPKPESWQQPPGKGQQPQQSGPPDLDELWRDFNRKLGQLFGGNKGPQRPQGPKGSGSSGGPEIPSFLKNLGIGVILGAAALVWLATGFFIVQEGQQAVITQFGKYHSTVGAGFNWRMPYPV
jgi:membrane protease subunit HflK